MLECNQTAQYLYCNQLQKLWNHSCICSWFCNSREIFTIFTIYCRNLPGFGTRSHGWPCHHTQMALHWCHNDHDGISNHQPHSCLLSRLFRRRSKKTSKLRVTGLCGGNSPGPVNSPHKGPVTGKMFPFDDIIMGPAAPGEHGGMANHGSWHQTMVNFHFTMMILFVTIKTCNVHLIWSRIILLPIDVTSSKSMRSSSQSMYTCMHDDIRIVDEYKQDTPKSNTHVNNEFPMSILHKFENITGVISSLCTFPIRLWSMNFKSAM